MTRPSTVSMTIGTVLVGPVTTGLRRDTTPAYRVDTRLERIA